MSKSRAFLLLIQTHRRFINRAFQILVIGILSWVLYAELHARTNLSALWQVFVQQLYQASPVYLLLTLLLLPLNWLIEAIKWRYYMLRYEPISLVHAFKAVLAGICFALITPNRIGEIGGRMLFVRRSNQWHAVLANVVGSIAQYLVNLLAGVAGGLYLARVLIPVLPVWWHWALVGALAGLLVCYVVYFNGPAFVPRLKRLSKAPYLQFLHPKIELLEHLSRKDLLYTYGWSAARYITYSTQYYFLLCFFKINPAFFTAYAGIFLIFFLQTILPLPTLASLLIRGNLAVFVWGHFGANEISALAATFLLWIINLILPALIGTFSLFSVHITKTIGYDTE